MHSAVWTFLRVPDGTPQSSGILTLILYHLASSLASSILLPIESAARSRYHRLEYMKRIFKGRFIYLLAIIFVLIIAGLIILAVRFGSAYKGGLANFSNQTSTEEVKSLKKKKILNITVKKSGEAACMQVTPDGIVRIFTTCNDDLEIAARPQDPKNILKLFKILSESDLDKLREPGSGEYYQLIIQTDEGTETIYIPVSSSGGSEIIQTIVNIKGDIPSPVASPSGSQAPGHSSSPQLQPTPSPSSYFATPSPSSGTQASSQIGFSCEFDEFGNKRPLNVSNIICSSEPSPLP